MDTLLPEDLDELQKRIEMKLIEDDVEPTRENILGYISDSPSEKQSRMVDLMRTIKPIGGYKRIDPETGEEEEVEGHKRTHSDEPFKKIWTPNYEEYVRTHTLAESRVMLEGRFTSTAIRDKRLRLLGRKA